jgi:hypothetical protein
MRRRADDWINATHILKVADYDKPARTRILEREVQKGVHEKVQGGYGKYQGTWIPLEEGRHLAERNGVLDKMRAIFDYVPGDRSPPPAPKHATAASNRMKPPKQTAAAAARNGKNVYSLESMQCTTLLSLVVIQASIWATWADLLRSLCHHQRTVASQRRAVRGLPGQVAHLPRGDARQRDCHFRVHAG